MNFDVSQLRSKDHRSPEIKFSFSCLLWDQHEFRLKTFRNIQIQAFQIQKVKGDFQIKCKLLLGATLFDQLKNWPVILCK